jgi:hypothetical protein
MLSRGYDFLRCFIEKKEGEKGVGDFFFWRISALANYE